jgi:toxin ParE1/3/4
VTTRLVLHAAAAADLEEAFAWYERAREGLGDEFLSTVRLTLDAVMSSHPHSYPVVYRGLRRALARRFP